MSKLVTVKALKLGIYDGSMRHPGSVFQVPEGFKGKWFKPVADVTEADLPKAEAPLEPTTLGQMKSNPKTFAQAMKKN